MKAFALERWCDRLQLSPATRDFLTRIRSSPPARRVQGRLLNVCGPYASRKMGVSIQFESHTVELWAIYTMEYDTDLHPGYIRNLVFLEDYFFDCVVSNVA